MVKVKLVGNKSYRCVKHLQNAKIKNCEYVTVSKETPHAEEYGYTKIEQSMVKQFEKDLFNGFYAENGFLGENRFKLWRVVGNKRWYYKNVFVPIQSELDKAEEYAKTIQGQYIISKALCLAEKMLSSSGKDEDKYEAEKMKYLYENAYVLYYYKRQNDEQENNKNKRQCKK